MIKSVLVTLCLLAGFAASLSGSEVTFQPLGDLPGGTFSSTASGVSADGSIIVGTSNSTNGNTAVIWQNGTITALESFADSISTAASGISADGSVIVGTSYLDRGHSIPVKWLNGGIKELVDRSTIPTGFRYAYDVSDDGSAIVGYEFDFTTRPKLWADKTELTLNHDDSFLSDSKAWAISADGNTVVGQSGGSAALWVDGELTFLEFAIANAISPDGSTIVGYRNLGQGNGQAVRWRDNQVFELPGLSGDGLVSQAFGVSADGSVIVGRGQSQEFGFEAVIWLENNDFEGISLNHLLEDNGILLDGFSLSMALAVSDDGSTIVGSGFNKDGYREAFLVTIPEPSGLALICGLLVLSALLMKRRPSVQRALSGKS